MDDRCYNYSGKRKRQTLYSLSIGSVLFAILAVLTKYFDVSLCPIKNIFGISCFGCGMTRGFISILHFDFKAAFEYNVLSIPLFVGIGLYTAFALADIIFNKDYIIKLEKQLSKKYMYLLYATILACSAVMNKI